MTSLAVNIEIPSIEDVSVTEDTLSIDLSDGRSVSVPIAWYPRLSHATPDEKKNWRLIGRGYGIHWKDIDEDISIESLITCKPSDESQLSLKKWLKSRSVLSKPCA